MREHVLLNVVRPYKKVTLKFLARELRLTETEVETMVVSMILAEDLHARIDQIKGYVTIRDGEGARSTNVQVSLCLSLRCKGLFVYNVGILCSAECCIR